MPEFEGATVPVPDGIYPLFLTGATQEGFGLQGCTVEDPYIWVPKADLLAEIQFKGAISDFSIVKKGIDKYPNEKLLVVLDDDEIYGQNFFICLKVQEAERVVAEEDAKAEARGGKKKKKSDDDDGGDGGGGGGGGDDEESEEEEEVEYVPPQSKPWVSLGSEAEVCSWPRFQSHVIASLHSFPKSPRTTVACARGAKLLPELPACIVLAD